MSYHANKVTVTLYRQSHLSFVLYLEIKVLIKFIISKYFKRCIFSII